MEARPSPRRLLTCAAALVAIAVLASGCGGGSSAQAAAKQHPPRLLRYSDRYLSFTYPAAWAASAPKGPRELHFFPLVYLSTQPVGSPCSVKGNTETCGWPIKRLEPGGVLALWQVPYSLPVTPSPSKPRGTPIMVGGRKAWRTESSRGECRGIGADRTIDVSIPASSLELVVCLREPGVAQDEKSLDKLLASTKFRSS